MPGRLYPGGQMGHVYDEINPGLREWIARQPMFFVGTAPLAGNGHVNVSPKGPIGSLRILGPRSVAYLDVSGSGAETIAHVRENGRIVIMLCAFEGPPRIVRLHGAGEVLPAGTPAYDALLAQASFEDLSLAEARRAIIRVEVNRVSDSCGYGVPLMSYEGMRDLHARSTAKKLRTMGLAGYLEHRRQRGARSLDGLPALAD
jgi:hypothetical protein